MFSSDQEFENEVRRIARLLWPTAKYGGATVEDGRERDGIFEAEDFIHLVEATTSRQKQKAQDDRQKLEKLAKQYEAKVPHKFIKGWFVTRDEPTADQRDVFKRDRNRILAISFEQFRSKLIDAYSYLDARDNFAFGSLRDPETGDTRAEID